ncbi:hypothetical protein Zmor_008008 [Zophobas morio]|uniref:Uncharacterized protein n=1 Tax=Zophobas morio TaxID=2755281 RepID=A0AA38IYL7_9CUCU|nr:hypothetical protein Zmor_008008 [Zophobas morio]
MDYLSLSTFNCFLISNLWNAIDLPINKTSDVYCEGPCVRFATEPCSRITIVSVSQSARYEHFCCNRRYKKIGFVPTDELSLFNNARSHYATAFCLAKFFVKGHYAKHRWRHGRGRRSL